MVMEISPEVIYKLALMYSTVVRYNVLGLQKMEDGLLVFNVIFFCNSFRIEYGSSSTTFLM